MSRNTRATAQPLVVENVSVTFGGLKALTDVSFVVVPGTIHAVIGPNGAGKSTCFNVVSGLYRTSSGTVRYGNIDLTRRPATARARVGIGRAFQNINLSLDSTVLDNVMTARHSLTRGGFLTAALGLPRTVREQRRHEARCREICEYVGIAHLLDRWVGALSYGDQKRTDLARAIAMEPSLLLLDEPTAGLNEEETIQVGKLVLGAAGSLGISILLIDHDMSLVMGLADHITVLDFGRVIASGAPEEVRHSPAVLDAYLGGAAVQELEAGA
ncbi:ABC transporter ATP-binding protein [Nonomuraea wenchangensis]|uniref:ABC transporter ATP-binding protein n=1 Tax=Nonomuraea wenchangensis TaxID=568860 RepID=UPI0037118096